MSKVPARRLADAIPSRSKRSAALPDASVQHAAESRLPLLDLRALVILILGVLAGWLAYDGDGWATAIPAAAAVITLLYVVLPAA